MTAATRERRPPPGNAGNAEPQQEPTIPPGYKQTEVGIIPEDWESTRIDAHAVIKTGAKNTQDRIEDGACPFFVRSQDVERIDSYSYDGEAVLTAGDGVGTGKVFHYVNGRFDVHQRVYRISDFSEQLSGRYFFFQFSTRFYDRIMSMTAKSSVDSVRMEMIAGMQLPLPPTRAEQEAIAGALSDADGWIESLEKLIEKKRAIKQGSMQALLTPPGQPGHQRLPGFKGEWEVKRLGEIGSFLKGAGVRKDDADSGPIPCIRYGEIYTHHKDHIHRFYSWISSAVASTAVRLRQGDILFAGSGETKAEIGKCVAYLNVGEAYAGGDIVIMRGHEQCPEFLGYYLNVPEINRQKASRGQGDAIVHITGSALASIGCSLPRFSEQSAIAAVLSDMDAEIEAVEAKLAKARQIKQGMMQELLTGRVRLVNLGSNDDV